MKQREWSGAVNHSFADVRKTFFLLAIFGVAMGFLEAIVVVYLRQMYYPSGFGFPLTPLPAQITYIESLREVCTIIMLICVGFIAGRGYIQKFSYFLYVFAVWDIFYYVGLKMLLNWPPSFLTWDILFLIPVPWLAPVLAPVICSLTMIFLAVSVIYLQQKGCTVKIKLYEWGLILSGTFMIFLTFVLDYFRIIVRSGLFSMFWTLASNEHFKQIILQYRPVHYNWFVFTFGEILILCAFALMLKRTCFVFHHN